MCGLVGILDIDGKPVSPEIIQRMTLSLAHRGPDGHNIYSNGPIALGHRRLAIIDLTTAASQPMFSKDGQYAIVFNGEIYNFRKLRSELEELGYQFRSHSDTEVLLYAYIEWHEKVVDKLNGMFAFAIWNCADQELFLARDRYGIKPLYYSLKGQTLLFGSEIKSLLEHPACRPALDYEALLEYFTFQNLFTDRTLFAGVQLLPAGTYMFVRLRTPSPIGPIRYWDYHFCEPENGFDDSEYLEELDRLLKQAVERQLVSDVDVGSYLSGGMDSGTLTAIAAIKLPYIKTFTCGFDLSSASGIELGFDERPKAEHMSYCFKTEHYEMVLKAGDMERIMPRLAWHIEEPRVGQSYPNFYISQLTSKFVKVVLSGAGGDEIFGGYPWRYYRAAAASSFEEYIDKYYQYWQRLIPNSVIHKVFRPIWNNVAHVWTKDIFHDVFANCDRTLRRPEDYINHSLYFEARTFLQGLLLVEDKLSMAHGLETRVPFLDNDLVDFAMRLPVHLKVNQLGETLRINENEVGNKTDIFFSKTRDGKLALRRVMGRYIPADIAQSEKQGFSAPDASWFRGESIEYVKREILSENARIYEYFDHKTILDLVSSHLEGRENRRLLIWSLLSFEWWLRRFLG